MTRTIPDVTFLAPRAASARLTRRALLAGFGVVGLGALSACGKTTKMAASPPTDGKIEPKLNLYSWGDYDNPELLEAVQIERTTSSSRSIPYGSTRSSCAEAVDLTRHLRL